METEYAKDEVFQVKYFTPLNRLKGERKSWTSRWIQKMKNHKLLTTSVIAFLMFAILNMILIFSFMKILQNI